MRSVTVVIPALNEAASLPRLLDDLARQTVSPGAVVVADAGSTDGTRDIAAARGAIVVDGGMPGVGRNAGARVAATDLILFLDADVALEPDAIASMLEEFDRRGLAVASTFVEPLEREARYIFACEVVALYLDAMQYVAPRAPGFCILIERSLHEAIGGFDETLMLAEDHDYVERAAEHGKFRMMRSVHVRTSMRRIAKEGLVSLAFKYLYCELQVMAGRKIVDAPFEYEFAEFEAAGDEEHRSAARRMREQLATAAEAVRAMSLESRTTLRELGETEIDSQLLSAALNRFRTEDVRSMEHYLRARGRLLRRRSKRMMAAARTVAAGIRDEMRRSE